MIQFIMIRIHDPENELRMVEQYIQMLIIELLKTNLFFKPGMYTAISYSSFSKVKNH